MSLGARKRLALTVGAVALGAVAFLVLLTGGGAQEGGNLGFTGKGYVSVADDDALTPTTAMTIEAWVYLDTASALGGGGPTFVGKGLQTSYWFGMSQGKLRFTMAGNSAANGASNVPLDQWVHVAVTYNKVFVKFYINGELDNDLRLSYPIGKNTGPLYIGADPGGSGSPDGWMDDVRIWSYGRLQPDLQRTMNCIDPAASGLVADWTFEGTTMDLVDSRPGTLVGSVALDSAPGFPCGFSTPTGTASKTPTASPTHSPTPSPTASPSPTPTPSPAPSPTPTPTPSPTPTSSPSGLLGNADCEDLVTTADLIATLESLGGVGLGASCPELANVNCNGGIDLDDVLRMLMFLGSLPAVQPDGCREINT